MATYRITSLERRIKELAGPKKHKINGIEMAQHMLSIMEAEQAAHILRKVLKVGERESERLIASARELGRDVLQI